MAGKQRRPGPGEKGGGGRANVDAGKILGAVLGGGGDNPAYGQDPGNSEINPDISKYGVDNPYKPLNWLGSVTGQQDYYSQFRYQKAVQDANFLHEKELQAIKNSDMTEQEKLRAANNSKLQRDNHIQAALVAQGIAPTEEAQRTATDAQRPLVASLASTAGNRMIGQNQLATTEAGLANQRLMTPQGAQERTSSLSAQDAAHAIQNEYQQAAAKKLGILELGPGTAAMPIGMAGVPGQVAQNIPFEKPEFDFATGQFKGSGQPHMSFMIDGKNYAPVPRTPIGGQLMPTSYAPGNMPSSPAAFTVPQNTSGAGKAPLNPSMGPSYTSPYALPPSSQDVDAANAAAAERDRIARQNLQKLLQPYLMSY